MKTTFYKVLVARPTLATLSVLTQIDGDLADELRLYFRKEGTVLLHEESDEVGPADEPDVEWRTLLTIGGRTVAATHGGNVDWRDPEEPLRTDWLEAIL